MPDSVDLWFRQLFRLSQPQTLIQDLKWVYLH